MKSIMDESRIMVMTGGDEIFSRKFIVKGSIVLIEGDLHEAERYEVLKVRDDKAKIEALNPYEHVFWIDLTELKLCNITKEEVVENWKKTHAYSGI